MALNLNTELALINTTNNPGIITLPLASNNPGRVINFKDSAGTFGINTLTLITSGSDTFDDGATQKILQENRGIIQIVASGSIWYILTGTQLNSVNVSTFQAQSISTINISTASLITSSVTFSLVSSIYSQSTLALFNSNVFAGTRVWPIQKIQNFVFNPAIIPGLTLWLDAANVSTLFQDTAGTIPVTTSGQSIAYWKDKTGLNKYIQATSGTRPTYSPNAVLFNGSQYLQTLVGTGLPIGAANGTYIFVSTSTDGSTSQYIVNFFSTDIFNFGFRAASSNVRSYYCGTSGGGGGTIDSVNFLNQPSICVIQLTGATSISSGAWKNSVGFNTQAVQTYNLAITSTSITNVGKGTVGYNYPFVGTISEILIFTTILSTIQRLQIEGYLAWKWGFQTNLPTNHPFYSSPPK